MRMDPALVLLQGAAGGHHLALVLLVVEADVALQLGLPVRGAAAGLLGGALGGGRGRGCQAGGEVGVDPAEGGGVRVDPGLLLLLGGGHGGGWMGVLSRGDESLVMVWLGERSGCCRV